jgi:hypothetical protein
VGVINEEDRKTIEDAIWRRANNNATEALRMLKFMDR